MQFDKARMSDVQVQVLVFTHFTESRGVHSNYIPDYFDNGNSGKKYADTKTSNKTKYTTPHVFTNSDAYGQFPIFFHKTTCSGANQNRLYEACIMHIYEKNR